MASRDYFDQSVASADGQVRVRCRPRGAELRDLFKDNGLSVVTWFSAWPGVLSLVGWLLNVTVYKRAWLVTAEPAGAVGQSWRHEALNREQAEAVFVALIGWLKEGHAFAAFVPPSSPVSAQ